MKMPADIEVHLDHTEFYKEWKMEGWGVIGNRYDYLRLTGMIDSIHPFYNRCNHGKNYEYHDGVITIVNNKRGANHGKSLISFNEDGELRRITHIYVNRICVKKQGPYVISG